VTIIIITFGTFDAGAHSSIT